MVGSLGVHVDQPFSLLHRDQIKVCLAPGLPARLQVDPGAGDQQLPAAAGIFYMADCLRPVHLHPGHKPVGPGQKNSRQDFLILHLVFLRLFLV